MYKINKIIILRKKKIEFHLGRQTNIIEVSLRWKIKFKQ